MFHLFSRRRPALALIGAAASWGLGAVISKRALEEFAPLVLLPIQLGVSVGLLSLVCRWTPQIRSRGLIRLRLLGVLNPGSSYFLSLLGLTLVSVSVSVLLWALEPLLIIALSTWLLGERITPQTAALSVGALAGAGLVVFEPGGHANPFGVILTLAGVAGCALYTVLSKRVMADGPEASDLSVVRVQQIAALAFSLVLLILLAPLFRLGSVLEVTPAGWISAVFSGVFYYSVAFWLYLGGLRYFEASAAGLYLNLTPVFGIIAGQILLHETLTMRQWWGAVVIVATLVMVSLHTDRTAAEPNPRDLSG